MLPRPPHHVFLPPLWVITEVGDINNVMEIWRHGDGTKVSSHGPLYYISYVKPNSILTITMTVSLFGINLPVT